MNPLNFVLGGWLAASSTAANEYITEEDAVAKAEASLKQIETELLKNNLTLTEGEEASFRSSVKNIWHR